MKRLVGAVLVTAVLAGASVTRVAAQDAAFQLKPSASIADVLRERIGKQTTVRMQSGEDLEGTVVAVGNTMVHLSGLTGKDFYDAVVSLDRISGVIMRVRK